MSDYTLDLSKIKPGDVIAFRADEIDEVQLGEWYCSKELIARIPERGVYGRTSDKYMILETIDPRRLTLDGQPCVKERFRVVDPMRVWDNEINSTVAQFWAESDARAYCAWRNREATHDSAS